MASVDGNSTTMDLDRDDTGDEAGPATKKSSSNQTRKAQNRLAQREFRLRKQQYIRDLEARVEILSGDKEERTDLTLLLVRNLLKENKELRELIKSMASFFGDGLGSCLPRLGLSAPQLDAILNRADTDTAHEAFLALKASKEMEEANPGLPLGGVRRSSVSALGLNNPGIGGSGAGAGGAGIRSKRKRSSFLRGSKTPELTPSGSRIGQSESAGPSTTTRAPTSVPPHPTNLNQGIARQIREEPHRNGDGGSNNDNNNDNSKSNGIFDSASAWDFFFQNAELVGPPPPPAPTPSATAVVGARPLGSTSVFSDIDGSAQANSSGFDQTVPSSFSSPSATNASISAGPSGPSGSNAPSRPTSTSNASPNKTTSRSGGCPSITFPSNDSSQDEQQRSNLRAKVAQLTSHLTNPVTSMDSSAPTLSPAALAERRRVQEELRVAMNEQGEAEKKTEALQLITYHLNNFRVNHDYALPPSLRPTPVQQTMPHEHAIDGIIFPGIRDRMILLRGRYDLVDAFQGYVHEFTIQGEDVLDHRSWESSEHWLNEFPMLADDEVYKVTNKWRASRNEPPLTRLERAPKL